MLASFIVAKLPACCSRVYRPPSRKRTTNLGPSLLTRRMTCALAIGATPLVGLAGGVRVTLHLDLASLCRASGGDCRAGAIDVGRAMVRRSRLRLAIAQRPLVERAPHVVKGKRRRAVKPADGRR
jgi:hypothetical protein